MSTMETGAVETGAVETGAVETNELETNSLESGAFSIVGSRAGVVVSGGRVRSGAAPARAISLSAGDDLVHRGAVNAHTHLYSGLAPLGLPSPAVTPRNFVEILQKIWWKLDRALDEQALRASARLYLANALLSGTTSVIDHHESPNLIEGSLDILADAADELGIRLATCYGATDRNFGRDEGRRGLAECWRFVVTNTRARVRGMVGVHASFTASDETLDEAGAMARELSVPVHVHVAEDGADVQDAIARGYPGALERLLARGALPPGSIIGHGIYLTPALVQAARAAGIWIVQNPRSNEGNRLPFARVLGSSPHVALGTDGWPAEMGTELAALTRLANADDAAVDTALLSHERLLASEALAGHLFGITGGAPGAPLAAGETADLVVAPASWPHSGAVRHVLVGGELVVENGVLKRADIEAIRAHAREQAPKLWERMATFD